MIMILMNLKENGVKVKEDFEERDGYIRWKAYIESLKNSTGSDYIKRKREGGSV